jgi:O-antigen biosynthesis protein WbqP
MSTPEKLAHADSRYIESRSFIGDLRIIAATVLGGGFGDAAIR